MRLLRSVAGKLIIVLLIFICVPVLIYHQFQAADAERTQLLKNAIREQGKAVAVALEPLLKDLTPKTFHTLAERVSSFERLQNNIKILLRPTQVDDPKDFYYIAALPALPEDYRIKEREDLRRSGIFDRLDDSCALDTPFFHRYRNPAGSDEFLTSITPFLTQSGCWVVITSHSANEFANSEIGSPYWSRPQVQISLAIYLVMAVIVLAVLFELRVNLWRFTELARRIRRRSGETPSFRASNVVPELEGVASEFDAMVGALTTSAAAIRSTAEETAHALKGPLGLLSQALQPLKRSLRDGDERGQRSIERIETAVERMSKIIERNRHLEEITAEALDPKIRDLNLNRVVGELLEEQQQGHDIRLDYNASDRPVMIRGCIDDRIA